MKPVLLITTDTIIPADYMAKLRALFTVHYTPTAEEQRRALDSDWIKDVQAVFALGSRGISRELMDRTPRLEIVVCKGAGHDGFDIAEMNRRGIAATHGSDTNASFVADHALSLMCATLRHIPQFDRAVRKGKWATARHLPPSITGKRLGIVGLGSIGSKVAERAHKGFEMRIGYHSRKPRPDAPYRYYGGVVDLAADSDILLLTCPGGKQTYHLVDHEVLDALGPKGYLVNMARGSVVDTPALIEALRDGRIAGAGLDVVEGEPAVPPELLQLPNVVITPHVGGHAPESATATLDLVISNLQAYFAGEPLLTPIPGSTARRVQRPTARPHIA